MTKNIEQIRDFYGVLLGTVETLPNGDKIVRNFPHQMILGYYRCASNTTTDFYGRKLGDGDFAVSLIYKNADKK